MGILDNKRGKPSKNWKALKNQEFQKQAKNRDVHATQNLERGEVGEVKKPTKERIIAFVLAALIAVPGYMLGFAIFLAWGFVQFIMNSGGASFLDFDAAGLNIVGDWKIYAWTAGVFLFAWLIINEKMMSSYRAGNSMVDTTDINSYENDQMIALPEAMREEYGWFPDAGAHSSIQVSSMLSHAMLDKKGLKRVEMVERHEKDLTMPDGTVFYKGEPVLDDEGEPVKKRQPIIDMDFGQELFTASGIPVSEKEIRMPVSVKGIEYNPVDDSGNRKDREKLDYDTVADLINDDWEIPDYEVQRPAGAYLVDVAPVNTMV